MRSVMMRVGFAAAVAFCTACDEDTVVVDTDGGREAGIVGAVGSDGGVDLRCSEGVWLYVDGGRMMIEMPIPCRPYRRGYDDLDIDQTGARF